VEVQEHSAALVPGGALVIANNPPPTPSLRCLLFLFVVAHPGTTAALTHYYAETGKKAHWVARQDMPPRRSGNTDMIQAMNVNFVALTAVFDQHDWPFVAVKTASCPMAFPTHTHPSPQMPSRLYFHL
jgi:hypothetical protein